MHQGPQPLGVLGTSHFLLAPAPLTGKEKVLSSENMPCPGNSWGILSQPPSCPNQQAGGPTQRPQGAPRPHSCSIPALGSQPERAGHRQSRAGHRQSQARNQAGWRPLVEKVVHTCPALPTLRKSFIFKGGCFLGQVPPSSLPLRSRTQFREASWDCPGFCSGLDPTTHRPYPSKP